MGAPTTSNEFLELVRKSGVVDEKRLEAYVQRMRASRALPEDLGKLAGVLVRDAVLTHFQAEQFLLGKWRRFTIGKYKVLERVGAGGMGSVYLCEHKFMRRRVAVKVLPMAKAEDSSALERFYREARAVAALDHPNIVRAYDIDQDDKLHFLVMEYVDGTNLQEIVKRHGPMDSVRVAHYMRQSAAGLQHAFQTAGVVHRDIKPGNVLIDRNGVVKVLDMGLARFFHDEEDVLTKKYDENVLGTADYLAPEQALDSHGVDIRADIYSLGATFYFCLTGNTPFTEGTVAQKLIWHQTRQPKRIQLIRPEVPDGLAAIVEKMMAKDPGQRYQTPADVIEALAPWTREPIPPPPEEEMPRLSPAAMGAAGFGESAAPIQPTSASTLSSPRRLGANSPITSPRSAPMPMAGGSRRVAVSTPPAVAAKLAPVSTNGRAAVATPKPAARTLAHDSNLSWERQAAETADPAARLDTAPHSAAMSQVVAARPFAPNPLWIWVGVGLAVTVLLALGAWFLVHKSGTAATNPAPVDHREPATFTVTRSAVPGSFMAVSTALDLAHDGDRIVVVDETLEEPLVLDSGKRGRNVTIEAGCPGKRVRWGCPTPAPGRLIALSNVEGLHLKGFDIDGQDRVPDLVVLSGRCPGLVLEDLHLKGFTHSAVSLRNCTASTSSAPVTLHKVRITSSKITPAALDFQVNSRVAPGLNRDVVVADCRLEGPFQAAVDIAGPVNNLEFRHNRFFNCDTGFVYRKAIPYPPIRMKVTSNTFHTVRQAALHFEAMPLAEQSAQETRIVVENNVFAATGELVHVQEQLNLPRWTAAHIPVSSNAHWLWFGAGTSLGGAPAGPCFFRKAFTVPEAVTKASLDIGCDDQFTAWLNGRSVGSGSVDNRRVHAFDVGKLMQPGRNVLAVQGTNIAGAAGLLVQLTFTGADSSRHTVVSDSSWKAARTAPSGWEQGAFADDQWLPAQDLVAYGQAHNDQWDRWTWDSILGNRFQEVARLVFPQRAGNVRDATSREGTVDLAANVLSFSLGVDPANNAEFLCYPKTSPLYRAGINNGPVGIPPEN
jgi:serine/threonine protein kinase